MEGPLKKKLLSVSGVRIFLGTPRSVLALKSPACAAIRHYSSFSRRTRNFPVNSPRTSFQSSRVNFIQVRNLAKMVSSTVKLNSGYEMPIVGFGLWKVNNDTCADQVYAAIKAGYRLFDGASDYGNEKEVGQGLARAIKDGLVKREDLFIVSKLWNTFHEGDKVEPIARKQLEDLQIDYFDLFLIHFPVALKYVDPAVRYPPGWTNPKGECEFSKATIQETWTAMESLVDKKIARSIGISNFSSQLIMDLLRYARIRPSTLQIEHHPYLQQRDLVKYCETEGIRITAYSSFGPLSFVEMNMATAVNTPLLFDHDIVQSIASKHGKTPAQVLLRWCTQRGIAVIPKSNNPGRLAQNLDVTGWDLEAADIDAIATLDKNLRFNNPLDYGFYIPIFA